MSAIVRPLRGPARPAPRLYEDPRWAERHSPAPASAAEVCAWIEFGDERDATLTDMVTNVALVALDGVDALDVHAGVSADREGLPAALVARLRDAMLSVLAEFGVVRLTPSAITARRR